MWPQVHTLPTSRTSMAVGYTGPQLQFAKLFFQVLELELRGKSTISYIEHSLSR